MMKQFFFLLLCAMTSSIHAFQAPSIPIKELEAEAIEFQNKKISLEGNVVVEYDIGTMHCDRAYVALQESTKAKPKAESQDDSSLLAHKIDLYGHVFIHFSDGSTLSADRGEIFCERHEVIFYAAPDEKVFYTSFCEENGQKIPVVVSGKKMVASMTKDVHGKSTLSDIRGEGAVTIEYRRPEIVNTKAEDPES